MRKRTLSREYALKVLYTGDIKKESLSDCLKTFDTDGGDIEPGIYDFMETIVLGVEDNIEKIDSVISESADNWKLDRMATIDRNVLRIATFELLFSSDVPPKVAINEAIELVKKYSEEDSGKFVNGILDRIHKKYRENG